MAAYETYNGEKIKSSYFREWLELDTDHLVIGFDSDRQDHGVGFKLEYRIEVAETALASDVSDGLKSNLANLIEVIATKGQHKQRLVNRLDRLFTKYTSRMEKCG